MKEINFTTNGGFPLEQETLKRLQAAYRDELYSMLKQHIGINNDQNYEISQPTSTTKGWLVIKGTLYAIAEGGSRTGYIRTIVTETALRFGDGNYNQVYTDYTAVYITQEEFDDEESGPNIQDTEPNAILYDYYELTDFETVGFLPIDGSKPMEGDLHLDGNKLSNLDTLETEFANLRAKFLKLGYSTELGTLGRALADEKKDGETALHVNYQRDWDNTIISGKIEFSEFAENSTSTQTTPLVVDVNGKVSKGNAYNSIPVGLIALWHDVNSPVPAGWVYCNPVNAGPANGNTLTIPNLNGTPNSDGTPGVGSNTILDLSTPVSYVSYIIYVGLDAPTIDIEHSVLRILSSGETSYDATAASINVIATASNLSSFTWEIIAPVTTPVSTPVITQNTDPLKASVTGELYPGIYTIKIKGIYTDGNGVETEYFAESVINIQNSNQPPVFESVYDFLNDINITGNTSIDVLTETQVAAKVAEDKFILRVGVSDPDGDIFSSVASVTCAKVHLDGSETAVIQTPEWLVFQPDTGIKYYQFKISKVFLIGDKIRFTATDEDGGVATKTYEVSASQEPSISIGLSPVLTETATTVTRTFNVAVQGNPSQQVELTAAHLISPTLFNGSGSITVYTETNTISIPMLSQPVLFSVGLDSQGYKLFQVKLILNKPSSTGANNDTTYTVSSKIALAQNENNNEVLAINYTINDGLIESEGPKCFDVESYVSLASGRSKKLKNIQVGDKLVGFDFPNRIDESNGNYFDWSGNLGEAIKSEVTVVAKRTHAAPNYYQITKEDGTFIKVTGEHPLLVSSNGKQVSWLPVKEVKDSMSLIDKKGLAKAIDTIQFIKESLEVATLDVETIDNYVIGGIVAHNKAEIEQTTP